MRPQRFLITSAQAHASPHTHFWEGLKHYADVNKAEIIVLPMIGKNASEDWDAIHPMFKPYLEYKKRRFNSNVSIDQFNVRPYQIDPLTGLNRFAQQGMTVIFASPKQRLKPVAHSNHKYPKFLMTTGACTRPNYATQADVSAERRRLGDIAKRDHIYGAIVLEIQDHRIFHFRQIRANTEGEFVDLGIRYSGNKTSKAELEAMVLGDYHNGSTEYEIRETTYKMIQALKPKRLVLHDFFDGHSISHHIEKKFVREKLIQIYDKHMHLLDGELQEANDELQKLSDLMKGGKIVVVSSNHHFFLHRWLEEARFRTDASNFRTSVKLLSYMAAKDYNDPVVAGIRMKGRLPKNIIFLSEDDDYKVRGYQLGVHGDRVPFGSGYGSMTGKENDFGKSISGHCHQAQILRNTYTVGTMLPINMFYMRGYPSNWTHTHALLWDTGTVQLVNIFEWKWRC